jgi:hypothetical protein
MEDGGCDGTELDRCAVHLLGLRMTGSEREKETNNRRNPTSVNLDLHFLRLSLAYQYSNTTIPHLYAHYEARMRKTGAVKYINSIQLCAIITPSSPLLLHAHKTLK